MAHFSHFPHTWDKKRYQKNTALSRTTSYGFLIQCQNLEKTNDPKPIKRLGGQTDEQTDRLYFIGPFRQPPGGPKRYFNFNHDGRYLQDGGW